MQFIFFIILFILIILVIYHDGRWHRIPNAVVASVLVLGYSFHGIVQGWAGLATAAEGFIFGFFIFLPLYLLKGMGAGDLKLMASMGAFLGWPGIVWALFYTSIIGGIMAIGTILGKMVSIKKAKRSAHADRALLKAKLPYGIAISLGSLMAYLYVHDWSIL